MGFCVLFLAILAVTSSLVPNSQGTALDREKRSSSYSLSVTTDSPLNEIGQGFLSVAIGAKLCTRLREFNTSHPKLINVARGLQPLQVRVGGTAGIFVLFEPDDGVENAVPAEVKAQWESTFGVAFVNGLVKKKNWKNLFCKGESYEALSAFFETVGWEQSIQFAASLRKPDGTWDPTNARYLLQHLAGAGITLHMAQLHNEVNSYASKFKNKFTLAGDVVAADYESLRQVLDEEGFTDTKIMGPDVSNLRKGSVKSFLASTVASGLHNHVDVITFHHFTTGSKRRSASTYTNPAKYDVLKTSLANANSVLDDNGIDLPFYATEVADSSGGGWRDYSNHLAGALVWIDQCGLVAKYKGSQINHQTFWSGNYGMIDYRTYEPNAMYWPSVVFKRLVEGKVFDVTVSPAQPKLRVYGNCARTEGSEYGAVAGDIIIYLINLNEDSVTISLPDYADKDYNLFLFTSDGLKSNKMYLNGDSAYLKTTDSDALPDIDAELQTGGGDITVGGLGIAFVHVKGAGVAACQ